MTRPCGPTRRQALALAPAALLAVGTLGGCTSDPAPAPTAVPSPSPTPVDPDEALRASAAAREQVLLREYDAVLAALPSLSPRLAPLRAHHVQHLVAVGAEEPAAPAPAAPQGSPSGAPSASSPYPEAQPPEGQPPEGQPPAVPAAADVAAALARLVAAERAAGQGHAQDCLLASRELAGVLGALSASELSHEVALA